MRARTPSRSLSAPASCLKPCRARPRDWNSIWNCLIWIGQPCQSKPLIAPALSIDSMKNTPLLRRPLFWIGLVAILALVAVGVYAYLNQPAARATSSTATVTRGDLSATVNANGRVQAVTSARLAFPASGLVRAVNVHEGDAVK